MGHFRQQRRIMWFICSEQHHLPCTTRDTIPRYYSIDLEKLNLSLDQEYLIGIKNIYSYSMVFSPAFSCCTIYDSRIISESLFSGWKSSSFSWDSFLGFFRSTHVRAMLDIFKGEFKKTFISQKSFIEALFCSPLWNIRECEFKWVQCTVILPNHYIY